MSEMHVLFTNLASTACPDVTTPRDPPSVLFEYPQYFSKISENSEKDSRVVVVKAVSNDGDMVFYSLEQSITYIRPTLGQELRLIL